MMGFKGGERGCGGSRGEGMGVSRSECGPLHVGGKPSR